MSFQNMFSGLHSVLMSYEENCNVFCSPWPVTSLELMATGILFMEMRERITRNLPHTIQQLKHAIREEIASIH
jgi:hypothetical protein